MTTPVPTGEIVEGSRGRELRLSRRLDADIHDVWAWMTESDRLEEWIGRWQGDPTSGQLTFFMTAEGDDVPGEEVTIRACDPPHRYSVDTSVGENVWRLRLELADDGGATTVQFSQVIGADDVGSVGPGWEYYLDRLTAAIDGTTPSAIDFDEYFPAMQSYYRDLLT
ncbi:SRPBCC family protein [Microbacterium lacus]|uniref:SRPBCC family protein n=1 Tax=Microbacterium lacus TaxID=415217 RepID=UPI00384D1DE8